MHKGDTHGQSYVGMAFQMEPFYEALIDLTIEHKLYIPISKKIGMSYSGIIYTLSQHKSNLDKTLVGAYTISVLINK